MTDLTPERLLELLDYDPETGIFTRRVSRSGAGKVGSVAGGPVGEGYWKIAIDGRRYLSHRLAWFWVHGRFPPADIDHINGEKADNRICNLREATRSENLQNQRLPNSNNKSGFLGVYWHVPNKKWHARICINRKNIDLGHFSTPELAHEEYLRAKRLHHPFGTI